MGKTLEERLDEFKAGMLAKFKAREAKHPGEMSVTHPDFDWRNEQLEMIDAHTMEELIEWMFAAFPHSSTEQISDWISKTVEEVGKKERGPNSKPNNPALEDFDIANMVFLDYQIRKECELV